jgi:cell wall-associated NlpC family hydrolase
MTAVMRKIGGTLAAGAGTMVALAAVGLQALTPVALSPTAAALAQIPASYLVLYQAASTRCPMPWTILAAVGQVESDQGRDTAASPAGAVGPMQFEPATWARWGVDGDGDGRKNPRDPADAIPAAADYLCALGVTNNPHNALVDYTCGNPGPACQTAAAGYAAAVLAIAATYGASPAGSPVATQAVDVALAQVGTPYLWGGDTTSGFDCSGLVQYSYARAGLALPRTAQEQYDATVHLRPATDLQPGDLVFFGTGPDGVHHVGIALGDGRMVDAPHTGTDVRAEAIDFSPGWFVGATRPTAATP